MPARLFYGELTPAFLIYIFSLDFIEIYYFYLDLAECYSMPAKPRRFVMGIRREGLRCCSTWLDWRSHRF
ncbi:hypothetical protein E8F20_21860 [Pseudomonas sp. BN415]|uniref:hypothetical protein n=1 Tax=Pseudomonas sp. BN415 TaxID=2567889 RepID=UPI002458EF46|nr:hypothetical protein [Pseudomonas sp. BN415]MDH4584507.1 hypothetical protein [Pseudomonas sp. BN415]